LYQIGRIAFNRTVGITAALLGAVYIYFVYYSAAIMTEAFYITAILALFYLILRFAEPDLRHSWRWVVALGVVLGIIILLRQLFMIIVPFLFLWVWWSRYRRGGTVPVLQTIVVGIIALCMILPFTLYNYSRFDRFVLLNTNAGYAFFWGNHPVYGTKFVPILTTTGVSYQSLIPAELTGLDEAALEAELLQRGLQFITDDPGRYALLSLSRIPPYFEFWPSATTSLIGNISRVFSFGILLPFMIAGIIMTLRHRTRGAFSSHPTFILLLFAFIYTAIHVMTWTLIRYRLPVDAVLLPFAALAIVAVVEKITGVRSASVTGVSG
jgi:4-amino-4-deoxy-L-arabinose transferase-like glycosyltransferase